MGYRIDIVKFKSKNFHVTRILDGLMDSLLISMQFCAIQIRYISVPVRLSIRAVMRWTSTQGDFELRQLCMNLLVYGVKVSPGCTTPHTKPKIFVIFFYSEVFILASGQSPVFEKFLCLPCKLGHLRQKSSIFTESTVWPGAKLNSPEQKNTANV